MNGPSPLTRHPMEGYPRVCFINTVVNNPHILVGDYSYFDDLDLSEDFERNVLYHYPFIGDKLIIGRFCAIARGVKFVMNGAHHRTSALSTFPFHIFNNGWEGTAPQNSDLPYKGDMVIGNDVWIGFEAVLMPGVKIGDGAIIGARSVVTHDVAPYTVVAGNPARFVRQRFPDAVVAELLSIRWWDWSAEKITRCLEHIIAADVDALKRCAAEADSC